MKKAIIFRAATALAAVLSFISTAASGQESRTYDIDITVSLNKDGSASVREIWDMSIYYGTEWYLVRSHLGDISVSGLEVTDETGRRFVTEPVWDTDRSIQAKSGRCGILPKKDGCELCWGLGSYGDHRFTAEYRMTNVVKSADDADFLHVQFVSPGIKPRPEHIRVTILSRETSFTEENSSIWAFGYEGTVEFEGGRIVAETDLPFTDDGRSVIILSRFDKGLFEPTSIQKGSFEEKKAEAFKGSSYEEYLKKQRRENILSAIAFGLFILLATVIARAGIRFRNRRIFGVSRLKEIGYERDLPFDGNLLETRYILHKTGLMGNEGNYAAALILRMVRDGILSVSYDERGKTEIRFMGTSSEDTLEPADRTFYGFLKKAAGADGILQDREFSRWARRNSASVTEWLSTLPSEGKSAVRRDGFLQNDGSFSEEGRKQARRAVGFKKFLKDFTLIDERKSVEVTLWRDYIIYAALFGIADQVAKELKDIDPKAFETYVGYDYPTMRSILVYSDNMRNGVTSAVSRQAASRAASGHGGMSSFGGGGGFSGGGFGGGAR